MAGQQHLAEAAFADHLEEVEVIGLGRRVGRRAQVDLLGRAGLCQTTRATLAVQDIPSEHPGGSTMRMSGNAIHLVLALWPVLRPMSVEKFFDD